MKKHLTKLPKLRLPKELKELMSTNGRFKKAFSTLPEMVKRDYVAYIMSGADSFRRCARAKRVMAMVTGDFSRMRFYYQ